MSQESIEWLNQNTLIGFSDKRGNAWHYRAASQGDESNHYDGAIPVEDIRRRLFDWQLIESPIYTTDSAGNLFEIEDRKAIGRSDKPAVLGVFKQGYQPHQYDEWLIEHVESIVNGALGVASAGLLKGGAVAWVQIEAPESIDNKHGVTHRPFILAATSADGSLSSTYKGGTTLVVCDNSLQAALGDAGGNVKIKHSRYSKFQSSSVAEALGIIEETGNAANVAFDNLCETPVSYDQFGKWIAEFVPMPEKSDKSTRSRTIADNKRTKIIDLYNNDSRVNAWRDTAFGVLQAANTYQQHESTIRGASSRYERNMENMISGRAAAADSVARVTLNKVLQAA